MLVMYSWLHSLTEMKNNYSITLPYLAVINDVLFIAKAPTTQLQESNKKLKSRRTCLTNHTGSYHATSYSCPQERTHTHAHTQTHDFWKSNLHKQTRLASGRAGQ